MKFNANQAQVTAMHLHLLSAKVQDLERNVEKHTNQAHVTAVHLHQLSAKVQDLETNVEK